MVLATEHDESESVSEMGIKLLMLWLLVRPRNLLHRNLNRSIFVFEQEHHELGRFRRACILTNRVSIVGGLA